MRHLHTSRFCYVCAMPTVVAAWTKVIVDYATTRGVEVAHDLDLSRPDQRVPSQVNDAIWQAADAAIGDADLGVHLAESGVSAASFGVVGYLVRTSTSVQEALERAQQYQRLIKDGVHINLLVSPGGATVVEMPEPAHGPMPRAVSEVILANYVHLARMWTGNRIVPSEVRFQHARPRDTRELERFFDCSLRFGQRDNALVLSRATLELPLVTAEPNLAGYLQAAAAARLNQLPQPT